MRSGLGARILQVRGLVLRVCEMKCDPLEIMLFSAVLSITSFPNISLRTGQ